MSRIALGLEYAGLGLHGWQRQPGRATVQECLERAVSRIANEAIQVSSAGRTDAGVHATAQVVHFDSDAQRTPDAWVRGVNSNLPEGVAVLWSRDVDGAFHARYGAQAREYVYLLRDEAVRPALNTGFVGWFHQALDVSRMQSAAHFLIGRHDFSAFRASECQARTPVRELFECEVVRRGAHVVFRLRGAAFLHHMVRNIVGSLVYVGCGRWEPSRLAEVLGSRDRRQCAPTFMAAGLYFNGVDYGSQWGLPNGGRIRGRILPGGVGHAID